MDGRLSIVQMSMRLSSVAMICFGMAGVGHQLTTTSTRWRAGRRPPRVMRALGAQEKIPMRVTIRRCSYRVSGIQAARVAASLRRNLNLDVELVEGHYGELTVLVDGEKIIGSGALGFIGVLPSVRIVRELVERRLHASQ